MTWHTRRGQEGQRSHPPPLRDRHKQVTVSCVTAPVQTYIPVKARLKGFEVPVSAVEEVPAVKMTSVSG